MLITTGHTFAQTGVVTTNTYTTSQGIVSEFGPDGFLIRTTQEAPPVRYTHTEKTTYVDEDGNPVAVTTVKSGQPVTVYYSKSGDALVASRIVVRRAQGTAGSSLEAIETTTMSQGTIGEFGPNRIILNPGASGDPVHYTYGETTTYVDEDGNPVSLQAVKSGLPVTVYYTRSGKTLIANKVIVRRVPSAPDAVIEKKTTTTTDHYQRQLSPSHGRTS
jgi:hypothetical protein